MQKLPQDLQALKNMYDELRRDRAALTRRTKEFHQTVAYIHAERARSFAEIGRALGLSRGRAQQFVTLGNK